ncbi:hypothetical protein MYX07_03300 [Patescibacteria group bacterium AH-259-L07]|nr:hypothetical protein [Patescibacteria group bacterium AH-259-L07]
MKQLLTIVMVGMLLMGVSFGQSITPGLISPADSSIFPGKAQEDKKVTLTYFTGPWTLEYHELIFTKIEGIAFYLLHSGKGMTPKKAVKRLVKFLENDVNFTDETAEQIVNGIEKHGTFYPGKIIPKNLLDISSGVAKDAVLEYWQNRSLKD